MRSMTILVLACVLAGCTTIPGAVTNTSRVGAAVVFSGATILQTVGDSVVGTITNIVTDANNATVAVVRQVQ